MKGELELDFNSRFGEIEATKILSPFRSRAHPCILFRVADDLYQLSFYRV